MDPAMIDFLPAYKRWGYNNTFAKGFLLTPEFLPDLVHPRWQRLGIGPYHLQVDPELPHESASAIPRAVSATRGPSTSSAPTGSAAIILGYAWDQSGRRSGIAKHLLRLTTQDELDEYITWLTGRFVILVWREGRLLVYSDPLATRSVYHHEGGGIALASHAELLSRRAGGLPSTEARWILRHPDYQDPFGRWIPTLTTTHDGVGQLYANHRLELVAGEVRQQRFFPRAERQTLPLEEAATAVRDEFRRQVRLWSQAASTRVLTLTGGSDSHTILKAARAELDPATTLALTYHSFTRNPGSTKLDVLVANARATRAGLRHLIIDLPNPVSEDFRGLYTTTFPVWARHIALAAGLYRHAPARAATMYGIGGAILTSMWATRDAKAPTPEVLAAKYTASPMKEDPRLLEQFERWMDHTQFTNEALKGHDFYDFFHWEHRMTKWAGYGYSEFDLATTPAPIFSSRRLLLAGLSVPLEDRMSKAIYRHILEEANAQMVRMRGSLKNRVLRRLRSRR
ncbi:MAG: hypothetical protein Q4G64_08035 [bacterium]|nr:hypothetical protein [bacterium]